MKKIILIIILTLAIFQMATLAIDIYIGANAIDRDTSMGPYTMINNNSANESGTITSVEIWASINLTNCEVATFFNVSGVNFSTRDYEAIGTVTSGSKQTFPVSLNVEAGDFIGIHYTAGNIERDTASCNGMWIKSGDNIPCTNITFTSYATSAISLYGTGTTTVGWSHKWNTLTISIWDTAVISKWNDLE